MCMIFTALRKYENADINEEYECNEEDFNACLSLVTILLQHSTVMFEGLPRDKTLELKESSSKKKRLLKELPNQFTRKQAVDKAEELYIKEGTVNGLLSIS
jgi:hypothetical protein